MTMRPVGPNEYSPFSFGGTPTFQPTTLSDTLRSFGVGTVGNNLSVGSISPIMSDWSRAEIPVVPLPTVPVVEGASMASPSPNTGMTGLDKINTVLAGIGTIGNLWNMFQAQKLAKRQFRFQKDITETNLANQIKSYNTALADRINSRSFTEGRPEGYAQQYIQQNQLSRNPDRTPGG